MSVDALPSLGEAVDLPGFFTRNPPRVRTADILALGPGPAFGRLGEIAAIFRLLYEGEQQRPFVREVVVVLPPTVATDDETVGDQMRVTFEEMFTQLLATLPPADDLRQAFQFVSIARTPDLRASSLLEVLRTLRPGAAALVVSAGLYRTRGIEPRPNVPQLSEDVWTPHVCALARAVLEIARDRQIYALLDVGEFVPDRPDNGRRLTEIDDVGVLGGDGGGPRSDTVAADSTRWRAMAREGAIGAALAEVEQLDLSLARRALIRLHLLNDAGLQGQARLEIETTPHLLDELDQVGALQAARVAEDCDADEVARRLLTYALPDVEVQELLELALGIAERLRDADLITAAEARLTRLFPESLALAMRRLKARLEDRDYREASELARGQAGMTELADFYGNLADALEADAVDYRAVIADVERHWPSYIGEAVLSCALDLEAKGHRDDAIRLLAEMTAAFDTAGVRLASDTLRMLERGHMADDTSVDEEVTADAVEAALARLALAPRDTALRLGVARIFRPDVLGYRTPAFLVASLLAALRRPVNVRAAPRLQERPALDDPEQLMPLVRRIAGWLGQGAVITLRGAPAPRELIELDPDEAIEGLLRMIEHMGANLQDEGDLTTLNLMLAVGCAIAPHAREPHQDLVLMRLAAALLATAGRSQRARDMAEQLLQSAGSDPQRLRLAWFGYADVFARLHNEVEALVALICALNADDTATLEQIWYETVGAFRLLRDLGISTLARPLLASARQALDGMGGGELYGHRLELLEMQAEFYILDQADEAEDDEPDRIDRLVTRAIALAARVGQREDEAGALTSFLAQLIRVVLEGGRAVPPEADAALAELLARVPPQMRAVVAAISANPTLADVVAFAGQIEAPRFVEDVGFDLRAVSIAARRLLSSPVTDAPDAAVFASELLADQAVTPPGSLRTLLERPLLPRDPAATLEQLRAFAADAIPVVVLAIAVDDIVRVTADAQGVAAPVREAREVFSFRALAAWKQGGFPYAYGFSRDLNIFYTSTDRLGVSALPDRAVLVMSTGLQGLPPNLLQVGDDLAGRTRRLASAPSVAWLAAAAEDGTVRTSRRIAWIPAATDEDPGAPLRIITDALGPTLEANRFDLLRAVTPPEEMTASELVVIAAHGQVVAGEGRFFRSIQNDAGALVAPSALSHALRSVGVAVLFVCSGGRIDEHPGATTTIGLTRQLLNEGCRAVIAPPWPLKVGVPFRWLPTFLARWEAGDAVIDACFAANQAVLSALGDQPEEWLAMSVYGDPLASRTNLGVVAG